MTLRLTVDRDRWLAHVASYAAAIGGERLVAVVKGNGYGFGRDALVPIAATITGAVAVGTVHEARRLGPVPDGLEVSVLTPSSEPAGLGSHVALTVGHVDHLASLDGHTGAVAIKLRSSMRRFGATPDEVPRLVGAVRTRGLDLREYVVHLPLRSATRSDDDQVAEIESWLAVLPDHTPISVSHLAPDTFDALARRHPERRWRLRAGTALWHGDKGFVHLGAEVVDVHPIAAGETAGYRSVPIDTPGHLVVIGVGSTHGVLPLADGRSPFHFRRSRLALVEPPHMHSSMCFVPAGSPVPGRGDVVDVQRPLTMVQPDEVTWR